MPIKYMQHPSPIGMIIIASEMSVIIGLKFLGQKNFSHWPEGNWIEGSNDVMSKLSDELDLYFSGDLFKFSSPIHFQGTKFQKQIWKKLPVKYRLKKCPNSY